jgi:hypothetical protein
MAMTPALKRWAIFIKSISMAEAFATKGHVHKSTRAKSTKDHEGCLFVVSFVPFV